MYWTPAYRIAPIADCMGLNRFETIKRFFHVNNNVHHLSCDDPNYDPLFKVKPLLNHVRDNCRNVEPEVQQCIDEQKILRYLAIEKVPVHAEETDSMGIHDHCSLWNKWNDIRFLRG